MFQDLFGIGFHFERVFLDDKESRFRRKIRSAMRSRDERALLKTSGFPNSSSSRVSLRAGPSVLEHRCIFHFCGSHETSNGAEEEDGITVFESSQSALKIDVGQLFSLLALNDLNSPSRSHSELPGSSELPASCLGVCAIPRVGSGAHVERSCVTAPRGLIGPRILLARVVSRSQCMPAMTSLTLKRTRIRVVVLGDAYAGS